MKDYKPLTIDIGDEIYPNGIFNFSISRICEHIALGELEIEKEQINIKEWFKSHIRGAVNEDHLPSVDVSKAVIQVEIRPDRYEIIDGNHRIEKACRDDLEVIESFKLKGEQLLPYFADERGYKAFVEYWNLKVKEDIKLKKVKKEDKIMTHKFEPVNKNKLDNEWRRLHLPPLQTLEKLGLMSSDTVADIGCGIGYFSVSAAEILSERNKVFALDTSDEMLAEVEKRLLVANISNVVTIKTEEYDLKLPEESITFALLVNVLHEIEDKQRFIGEIKRVLKSGGRLAIIEWKKEIMEMGPKITHRIGIEEVTEVFNTEGFNLISETQFAEVFYGIVFQKNADEKDSVK